MPRGIVISKLGRLFTAFALVCMNLEMAFAAPRPNPSPSPSPTPARPAIIGRKIPDNPFRCDRLIKYKGKTLPCDSHLKRDGENLRSILQDTPEALEKLDLYQKNRRRVRFAAYTGTAGVVIALTNGLIAKLFVPKERRGDQNRVENAETAVRWAGIGLSVGSLIYGVSYLKSNEQNLNDAIVRFNTAHPDRPIEVLFKHEF